MEALQTIFQIQNVTFQEFAKGQPVYLWLNVLSEGILALAFFSTAVAAIHVASTKDRLVRRVAIIPILFLIFSGVSRLFVVFASWISIFQFIIIAKAFSAVFCALSAAIVIPNLRRMMRLNLLEASHKVRLELEKQIELRDKSERMLRLYEEIVKKSSQGVVAFCLKRNKIFFVNSEFSRISGFPIEELVGQPFSKLALPEDEHNPIVSEMTAALDAHGVWRTELSVFRKDRSRFWCEVAINKVSHPDFGEILVSSNTDISDRKAAEEKILIQQAQITTSAKMAALGEMAAGIGHEINNPLASIQAHVEDLKELVASKKISDEQVFQRLSKIEKTGERIAKIIRGLRTFARAEAIGEKRRQPLREVVLDTLEFCSERFRQSGIALHVQEIPQDVEIECLPGQISQVLLNLLNNSFDAVERSETRWVEVAVKKKADQIEIRITDSGGGISPIIRSRIMQPFFTTKEPGKGSGLGLSISQGIIASHSGTLKLNEQSAHTEFVICLPVAA